MKKLYLSVLLLFSVFLCFAGTGEFVYEIPGLGETGFKYLSGNTYAVSIPELGTYEFEGYVRSASDFELTASLPVGDIPVAGQVLGLFGLDSASYQLSSGGLGLTAHLENGGLGALRGDITAALSSVSALRAVVDEIIGILELEYMDLNGKIDRGRLKGSIKGRLSLAGISIGFSTSGSLNAESVVKAVVVDLPSAGLKYLSDHVLAAAIDAASEVGRTIANGAEAAYRGALTVGHDVSSSANHMRHNFNKCYRECVPEYAHAKAGGMLSGANKFTLEYYARIVLELYGLQGKNTAETKALRELVIHESWVILERELDARWNSVYHDSEVDNYFSKNSSERKGREKYKQIVQAEWQRHKEFRRNIRNELLTIQDPLKALESWSRSQKAVILTHRDTSLCLDVANAAPVNGTNVCFYENTGGNNQMWYFHYAGAENTYYIQSAASGQYIHIKDARDQKGQSLITWADRGGSQTRFRVSVDNEGFFHFKTQRGNSFDLAGGQAGNGKDLIIWEDHGAAPQQFTALKAPDQPLIRAGEYRLYTMVPDGQYYLTADDRRDNGVNIYVIGGRAGSDTQLFSLTGGKAMQGRQTWRFWNHASERFIHLHDNHFWPGTNLICWEGFGGENTRFFMEQISSRQYRISVRSGNVFECWGAPEEIRGDANACIYMDLNHADQKWSLVPVHTY